MPVGAAKEGFRHLLHKIYVRPVQVMGGKNRWLTHQLKSQQPIYSYVIARPEIYYFDIRKPLLTHIYGSDSG